MARGGWFLAAAGLGVAVLVAGCTGGDEAASSAESASSPTSDPAPGATAVLDIGLPRAVHRATPLTDGTVLLTGGCSEVGCEGVAEAASAVIVMPDGSTRPGPSMHVGRVSHSATLLSDGRVLVVGGYPGEGSPPTASIEIYDPTAETFEQVGELRHARADHTASLLPGGRVLVAGGRGVDGQPLRTVELVDPAGRSVAAAPLPAARTAHTATDVGDCVLLIGGADNRDRALATSVSWCRSTRGWSTGPTLGRARVKHAAIAVPDGTVWVVGGSASTESRRRFRDTEILDLAAQSAVRGPEMPTGRYKIADAAARLDDGRVVVAGGRRLLVFDPMTRRLSPVSGERGDLGTGRLFQTVSALPGGRVLVTGGYDATIAPTDLAWLVRL